MHPEFESDVQRSLEILNQGGIILYPTDTIWGIGGDATREDVVERILDLKQRPREKAMLVLLASNRNEFDHLETGNRPTTFIIAGLEGLAPNLPASDGSIGVRVPRDAFCQELLKRFGKPLISTSANLSGQPSASLFSEICQEILEGVDYVVNWRQKDSTPSLPSRVVKVLDDGNILIIRE